jgi:hypothetical protein
MERIQHGCCRVKHPGGEKRCAGRTACRRRGNSSPFSALQEITGGARWFFPSVRTVTRPISENAAGDDRHGSKRVRGTRSSVLRSSGLSGQTGGFWPPVTVGCCGFGRDTSDQRAINQGVSHSRGRPNLTAVRCLRRSRQDGSDDAWRNRGAIARACFAVSPNIVPRRSSSSDVRFYQSRRPYRPPPRSGQARDR